MISSGLKKSGLTLTSLSRADVVVVNGCTLTQGAERDLRRFINRVRDRNKEAKIVLTGCHAQVYPRKSFGADLVLGQGEKFRMAEFLSMEGCFVSNDRFFSMEGVAADTLPSDRTRVFFKIQDGCDRFCTYCVVPLGRGKPRSRPVGEIVAAMRTFSEKGVKEAVLTGIEISAYRDPLTGVGLKDLLSILDGEETPERIRISSVDPLYIDEEFIHIVAASKKIMKSLHIPLQSGSNDILKAMGRPYSRQHATELIRTINQAIPGVGIGVDMIVGFPGEDVSRFMETYRLVHELDIYYLHVFPFSPREGTRAAAMEGMVEHAVKKRRVQSLRELDREKRRRFNERHLGRDVFILVEGKKYGNGLARGYTDNYIPVFVPYDANFENRIIQVTIRGLHNNGVIGEPVR